MNYESALVQAEEEKSVQKKRKLPMWIIYLLPSMLIFAVFIIYPFINTMVESAFATSPTGQLTKFVGFSNYTALFTDSK